MNSDAHPSTPPKLSPVRGERLDHLHTRLLQAADTDAVMALRDQVLSHLPHPDLYVREADERGFVLMHLTGASTCRGETMGVFDHDRLVAYAMLGLPTADDPDNLGKYFPTALADPARTAHLASCMVLEPYRGRHLQRMLLVARIALAQARERDFFVAMVSLHNHASRHNMMREGLRIGWVGQIDGLHRQLLAISPGQDWQFDKTQFCQVDGRDWQRQSELTDQGWWGVQSRRLPCDEHQLTFMRRIA